MREDALRSPGTSIRAIAKIEKKPRSGALCIYPVLDSIARRRAVRVELPARLCGGRPWIIRVKNALN
jgi:hypothetical protein